MSPKKLALYSLLHALGTLAYILVVVGLMNYLGTVMPGDNQYKILGPATFLMLFVLSAAITGTLVIGRPIMLYLENQKSDAVKFLLTTLGWMAVCFFVLIFVRIVFFL